MARGSGGSLEFTLARVGAEAQPGHARGRADIRDRSGTGDASRTVKTLGGLIPARRRRIRWLSGVARQTTSTLTHALAIRCPAGRGDGRCALTERSHPRFGEIRRVSRETFHGARPHAPILGSDPGDADTAVVR